MFPAREAARFIRERRKQPFVLCVNFIEPHRPCFSPLDSLYPPVDLPVGPEFRRRPSDQVARVKGMLHDHFVARGEIDGEDINTEEGCRRLRSRYHGMCSLIGFSVGQILAAVEETGQRENTIIVCTSDHGDQVGDHGLWGKSCSYEGSVRVPLILHLPGMEPDRVAATVSQMDLAPTLLEALGVTVPGHLQGRSWLPVLRGDQATDTLGDVFVEFEGDDGLPKPGPDSPFPAEWHDQICGPWRSVVTADGWKLNLSTTDRAELFDLNSDPAEIRNLFGERGQSGRVRDLTRRIRECQDRTEDRVAFA